MNKLKPALIWILICHIIFFSSVSGSALDESDFNAKYQATAAYLQTLPIPSVGSIGGDWLAFGLARSGHLSESTKNAYYTNVENYVTAKDSPKLHRTKSTENSRVIIALAAIGKSADNVAGYDLISPLMDFDFVNKQGINGAVWALIALDTYQYPVQNDISVENPTTREKLIERILSAQISNGGWGLDGIISDPDMTSMAIQALAPYRLYDSEIQAAIDKGVDWLISVQTESGGYYSYDDFNPESCAQVITALTALGIDPQTDTRFNKNGKSVIDSMFDFSVENGFEHTKGNGYNQMSTEQAFYAMTAYHRFLNRQTALYDMSDIDSKAITDVNDDGTEDIKDVTCVQRFIAEFHIDLTTPQKKLADLDGSGFIDVKDVTKLQRILAQME